MKLMDFANSKIINIMHIKNLLSEVKILDNPLMISDQCKSNNTFFYPVLIL